MKKILLLLTIMFFAVNGFAAERINPKNYLIEFHGSRLLTPLDTTTLTDASPTLTKTIDTQYITDLVADLTMDKGGTLVITPLLDVDDLLIAGEASTTLTLSTGGGTARGIYSKISAPYAKIVVTKTEAGDTTDVLLSVRGLQQ